MQRVLIVLARVLPLWLLYGVMALAIPFYVIFDAKGRNASYSFFRRRIGRGRLYSAVSVFLNMFSLGKVVIDRFASYAGKTFRIENEDMEMCRKTLGKEEGIVLLSSHVGNYEMLGYSLPVPKPMKVLVYAGETETVMENRSRLFTGHGVQMVSVKEDLSHLFILNGALSKGEIVSLPADRSAGSAKCIKQTFMGEEASFPLGPFTMGVLRENVSLIAVYVIKKGLKNYRIFLDTLDVPSEGTRAERTSAFAKAYAASLEKITFQWPEQWYNFFDFWAE